MAQRGRQEGVLIALADGAKCHFAGAKCHCIDSLKRVNYRMLPTGYAPARALFELEESIMSMVLLISDDDTTIRRTRRTLADMCFSVVVAETEEAVTRLCAAARPSIVITDVEMRGGAGFESIARVRRLDRDVYVLAISRGNHQDLWPKVAEACGADDYVPGPLTAPNLVNAIDACNARTVSESCLPDGERLN